MSGKLFNFLCFIPTLKTRYRFSLFSLHCDCFHGQRRAGDCLVYTICAYQHYIYNIKVIPMRIQEGDGYARFRMNFRYRGLCISYYTVKTRTLTLDMVYLLSCIKPAGDPMGHSQNTDLTSSGSRSRGGPRDHQNHPFSGSEFLYTCYLHIY